MKMFIETGSKHVQIINVIGAVVGTAKFLVNALALNQGSHIFCFQSRLDLVVFSHNVASRRKFSESCVGSSLSFI